MTPNQITTLRVGLAFAAVALFGRPAAAAGLPVWSGFVALALIAGAIALDAVDGYLARRKNLATPLGAQLDILGDRLIENLLFTYFAVCGLISLWVPIVFFVRGMLTDFLRGLAARAGSERTDGSAFRRNWMLESRWGRTLVASRASRGAYGALKCACFCYLGIEWIFVRGGTPGFGALLGYGYALLQLGAQFLVITTVVFCLLRALPVFWEGRRRLALLLGSGANAVRLPARASIRTV